MNSICGLILSGTKVNTVSRFRRRGTFPGGGRVERRTSWRLESVRGRALWEEGLGMNVRVDLPSMGGW